MARMLCLCAPGGQDEFFLAVGFPVASRASPPPQAGGEEIAEKRKLLGDALAQIPDRNGRAVTRAALGRNFGALASEPKAFALTRNE